MASCTRLCLWRTIAFYSLMISLLLVVISVCGLLSYYCMFTSASKFQMDNTYFTYITYFYSHDCVNSDSDFIIWKSAPSEKTWGWVVAYLVVNTLWFFTSLLLCNAPSYWKTSSALWLTYPWLFVTFGVLCMDVAASVVYGIEYNNIDTLDKLFDYIMVQFTRKEGAYDQFEYVPVPSIIMVGVFSKAIIGWLLVFISFITIYIMLVRAGKPESLYLQTDAPFDYYVPSGVVNPAFTGEMSQVDNFQLHLATTHPNRASPIGELSRNDLTWANSAYHNTPHLLPRVTLRPMAREDSHSSLGELRDIRHSPPPDMGYHYNGFDGDNRPWSYLPATPTSGRRQISKPQPSVTFVLNGSHQSSGQPLDTSYRNNPYDGSFI